jgi:glycogen operon protein
VFRRRRFLTGADASELGWFTPAGTAMTDADWADGSALAIAIYLDGSDAPDRARDGTPMIDDDFLVLVNAWWEPLKFTIPACRTAPAGAGQAWLPEIDTYEPAGPRGAALHPGDQLSAGPRSISVLRAPRPEPVS